MRRTQLERNSYGAFDLCKMVSITSRLPGGPHPSMSPAAPFSRTGLDLKSSEACGAIAHIHAGFSEHGRARFVRFGVGMGWDVVWYGILRYVTMADGGGSPFQRGTRRRPDVPPRCASRRIRATDARRGLTLVRTGLGEYWVWITNPPSAPFSWTRNRL